MNGVIHVGGHCGEEVPLYLSENRSPIILFEPQSLPCEFAGVIVARYALSDFCGTATLGIPHHLDGSLDTQCATLLTLIPDMARKMGWTPTPFDHVLVDVIRFDEWAKRNGFELGSCPKLIIDAHGTELSVLRGFGEYLVGINEVTVECSEVPIWEGGASTAEVEAFLDHAGFDRVSEIVPCGDVMFQRRFCI